MASRDYLVLLVALFSCVSASFTKDVFYSKLNLDYPVTMSYSILVSATTLSQCGMECTRLPGCRLFHYSSNSCYIVNMVTTGIGSVELNNIHVDQQLKEVCVLNGYTPLLGGIFCVNMSTYQENWSEAGEECQQDGGRLLIIPYIVQSLKWEAVTDMTSLANNEFWIGGNDQAEEGTWVWSDGSSVTGWSPGQPNNWLGNENCLTLNVDKLNDASCSTPLYFLCEKPYPFLF